MHVLVLTEQGLGDTIQFIRYVPLLAERGARVTVECQPRLLPLLKCLESDSIHLIARGEELPTFDMHARLMTLPHILGSTPDNVPNAVPYLSIDHARISRTAQLLASQSALRIPHSAFPPVPNSAFSIEHSALPLKIGLAWQGNPAHKGDRFRSIPLSLFRPLSQIDGIQLVSLQKGHGSDQIALNPDLNLLELSDPAYTTAQALLDTAAMMRNLDLVISVDTALAHLAGALAVPTWLLLPLAPDWRWLLDREDTPWYPTMKLFRQRHPNDWPEVLARVADSLSQLATPSPDSLQLVTSH